MKRVAVLIVFVLLIAGIGTYESRTARAQTGCTVASFTGAYGYNFTGIVYDNAGYLYYLQAVGRMVADGNGAIASGLDSGSNDGYPFKGRTYTGTYTVNADCTGSAVMNFPGGGKSNTDFVLVNGGKEAQFTQTDGGYVFGGSAKQQ